MTATVFIDIDTSSIANFMCYNPIGVSSLRM